MDIFDEEIKVLSRELEGVARKMRMLSC